MNHVAAQLDEKLRTLDSNRARQLEATVLQALDAAEGVSLQKSPTGWPPHYFEQTAGALAGEEFHRADQGELPQRDRW